MLKKLLFAVLLIVAVAAVFMRFAAMPAPLDENTQGAQRLAKGDYRVAKLDIDLLDSSRVTNANGDYAGDAARTLVTSVWYPEELLGSDKALPLLVYSHGFMSSRQGGEYLGEYFARNGYIVAAANFPLTHTTAPGNANVIDVVNQPGDVRFIVDTLLAWSADPEHAFSGAVDAERIGLMGLSLGGMTTTMAAYHPAYYDPRVKAAVSIAGPTFMFDKQFFAHRKLPFMMVATEIDALVPYAENAADIQARVDDAILIDIKGATHTGFSGLAGNLRFLRNADMLGCLAVTKNLSPDDASDEWYYLIGSPEQGVRQPDVAPELCTMDPLPKGMNPVYQQWLTTLAVGAFFDSFFADSDAERSAAASYLREGIDSEFDAVEVKL